MKDYIPIPYEQWFRENGDDFAEDGEARAAYKKRVDADRNRWKQEVLGRQNDREKETVVSEYKAGWECGFTEAQGGKEFDGRRFSDKSWRNGYKDGWGLGQTSPVVPRTNAGHNRRKITASKVREGDEVECLIYGKWVRGTVTHLGGNFLVFSGGEYRGVTVDRPAYWRVLEADKRSA